MLEQIAAAFAIIGGLYATYTLLRRVAATHRYKKPMYVFAGTDDLRDSLLKLRGRRVDFDTVLDFSVGDRLSMRIADETEYRDLLGQDASFLNGKRLPLYIFTDRQALDSFASLVLEMKQGRRLKFSHGGTGVIQVLLKGRFDIEARAYSGPSVEITLREV